MWAIGGAELHSPAVASNNALGGCESLNMATSLTIAAIA
jgi:hypothetical protein